MGAGWIIVHILQVFGILIPFVGIIELLRSEPGRQAQELMAASFGCEIMNMSYLLQIDSVSPEASYALVKMGFVGASIFYVFLVIFIMDYLGLMERRWAKALIVFWSAMETFVFCVLFAPTVSDELVFQKLQFVQDDRLGVSNVVVESGYTYSFRYSLIGTLLVGLFVYSNWRLAHTPSAQKRNRSKLAMLIGAELIVTLSFSLTLLGVVSYDIVPISGSISILSIVLSIIRGEFFSVIDQSRDWVVEHSDELFIITDNAYGLLDANEAARECFPELSGIRKNDILPDNVRELFSFDHPDFRLGERYYYRVLFPVEDKGQTEGYCLVLRDVTEPRKLLNRVREEKERANAANQAKSNFLSNMSHEIRTPINAVLGMDEMILRESGEEDTLVYAENIRTSGNTLLGLINDILDFSKIEAGKMDIIPVDYKVASVLNDLVNMIQPRAEAKGLLLSVEVNPSLPQLLHGDEIRIKQVVTNILTNAVKYTESGSVTLSVDFAKSEDNENEIALRIGVKDTGIGIKEEDIQKLFSAFERIEEERNRTIEGTGLGMNITQQLLAMMGSHLEVKSVYGEGSDFFFTLMQPVVRWTPIGDFEQSVRRANASRKKYRESFVAPDAHILVVDDTPMNLTVIRGLLKRTLVRVDTAESGREAIGKAEQNAYDVIFLDHRMPDMDGVETLEHIQKLPLVLEEQTPVICLTANAVSGAREEYLAAGFSDYLTKPIDSAKLEAMLMHYLPEDKVDAPSEEMDAVSDKRAVDARDGVEQRNAASPANRRKISETADDGIPDWAQGLSQIDISEGIRNCGSAELYREALEAFADTIADNADEIGRYFQSEDWENYTVKVHALKSSARIVGAGELSALAEQLEMAGNQRDVRQIRSDTPLLLVNYRKLGEELAAGMQTARSGENPPIPDEELAEAYRSIREFAAAFDYDSVSFIMDSLRSYRLPETEQGRFAALSAAVGKIEWEKIQRILA